MSQSDYIKYKRTSNELKYNDYGAVFNTGEYIDLKQYSLENSITNSKLTLNQLTPTGSKRIFNMEKRREEKRELTETISLVYRS